jgi:hypothetical protein
MRHQKHGWPTKGSWDAANIVIRSVERTFTNLNLYKIIPYLKIHTMLEDEDKLFSITLIIYAKSRDFTNHR